MSNEKHEVSVDHGPFPFRGENLALDLVNTEIMRRGKRADLLATPQDVAHWRRAASHHHIGLNTEETGALVYDTALLNALTSLRAALRGIFSALVEEQTPTLEDLNVLNGVLKTGYPALDLTEQGDLLYSYHTTDTRKGPLLLPIALAASYLIESGERKRLHRCGNESCIQLFYDTTKSATRRWCSLGCMDRARSAQRYKEAKRLSNQ